MCFVYLAECFQLGGFRMDEDDMLWKPSITLWKADWNLFLVYLEAFKHYRPLRNEKRGEKNPEHSGVMLLPSLSPWQQYIFRPDVTAAAATATTVTSQQGGSRVQILPGPGAFLRGICMFSSCPHGSSPVAPGSFNNQDMHLGERWKGVNVSVMDRSPFHLGPAMNWLVQDVGFSAPRPRDPANGEVVETGWMVDGKYRTSYHRCYSAFFFHLSDPIHTHQWRH